MIEQAQIDSFHRDGYLVVENLLTADEIATLQADFDGWVAESRSHGEA